MRTGLGAFAFLLGLVMLMGSLCFAFGGIAQQLIRSGQMTPQYWLWVMIGVMFLFWGVVLAATGRPRPPKL